MILPLYWAGYRPVYSPLGIVVADRLVTPVGWLSSSRVSATPADPVRDRDRSRESARSTNPPAARSVREMPNLDETRTPGAQTTAAVAPGIKIRACPVSGMSRVRRRARNAEAIALAIDAYVAALSPEEFDALVACTRNGGQAPTPVRTLMLSTNATLRDAQQFHCRHPERLRPRSRRAGQHPST
jgi:hypothetical protein